MWKHCIIAVIFLCGYLTGVSGALFEIQHVNFIQTLDNNFLFRGGNPNFFVFQYGTLIREFGERLQSVNLPLPSKFYLIDVNLLNPNKTPDREHIDEETRFFNDHSDLGEIVQHPILGETTSPFSYNSTSVKERALTFATWSQDKLPAFIEQIRKTMSQSNATPSVLYIHCECGCDRTGEISGSYYMAYMNMSLHDAHVLDEKIAGREILTDNHNALDWYCFYLKYAQNYNLTCEP